jgi:uncharacterized protein YoxC
VVSADDAAADLIKEHQAGEVVPIGDSQAVAAVLIHLLTDYQHWKHRSANAAALGKCLRWSGVAAPILPMLRNREIGDSKSEKWQKTMEDRLQTIIRERNSLIHDLEAHWNIATHLPQPFSFTGRLKQWLQYRLTGSLTTHLNQIANQQRSFNATVVNLAYRLSSASDEQIRRTDERFHSLRNEMLLFQQQAAAHLASLTQQLTELKPLLEVTRQEQIALRTEVQALRTEVQALRTEVQALRTEVQALRTEVQIAYDTLPPLHQHIIDLESRLLDVDEALSEVAYRLSDSSTTKPT